MESASNTTEAPPRGEIARLADHLFREEAGKLISVLTARFGVERLQFAEDVVQEALVKALQTWPYYGIPANPAAWFTQTAKNLAIDLIRREKVFRDKEPQIIATFEQWPSESGDHAQFDTEIRDDRLRLMFVCCHPQVPQEAQAVLALKTLCGFGIAEIASAFLSTEAAIAKRLVRARQKVRELRIPFEIPAGEELASRLEGVLQTLYLLFNEGYKASVGENLVREDLCREAIRLGTLLAEHPAGNQPCAHALLALMCLNAARLPARVDASGNLLRLKEQDRSKWDQAIIARGMFHLGQATKGNELTRYHLEAGIAACHCAARGYEATDWRQILALYDALSVLDDSPVVALNRAVAVAHVNGPAEGIRAVEAIRGREHLESYYLLYSVLGEFEMRLGNFIEAERHLRKALQLTEIKSERAFLEGRLGECGGSIARV